MIPKRGTERRLGDPTAARPVAKVAACDKESFLASRLALHLVGLVFFSPFFLGSWAMNFFFFLRMDSPFLVSGPSGRPSFPFTHTGARLSGMEPVGH